MAYEWHPLKAAANLKKHGISFEEAVTALEDPLAVVTPDFAHSIEEQRFICFGLSDQNRLLAVAFTEQDAIIRIITAREVTPKERKQYEEGDSTA